MSSVSDILNYEKKGEDDLYAILGCDEHSSVEQITAEYKVRALQYHPDKNEGNKDAEAKFQQLKEAKEILCDPEKRANYNKWRNSGISISYKQWLGMKEHVHQSMHWASYNTKDRMLPENAAGEGSAPPVPPTAASRRASEGGANIHWGGRGNVAWKSDTPNEVRKKGSIVALLTKFLVQLVLTLSLMGVYKMKDEKPFKTDEESVIAI